MNLLSMFDNHGCLFLSQNSLLYDLTFKRQNVSTQSLCLLLLHRASLHWSYSTSFIYSYITEIYSSAITPEFYNYAEKQLWFHVYFLLAVTYFLLQIYLLLNLSHLQLGLDLLHTLIGTCSAKENLLSGYLPSLTRARAKDQPK